MQFVCVTWIDAESAAGWQEGSDLDAYTLPEVHHVGWLVRKDRKRLTLAHGLSGNDICGAMHIPVGMVTRIKKLPDPR